MVSDSDPRNLRECLGRIGAELDRFLRGEHGDAVHRHDEWATVLTRALPEQGVGTEAVLSEIGRHVIPNGMRLAEPGWWGFITVAPDAVPVAAAAAAMVASPQRYTITAFNKLEELSLDWLGDLCGLDASMKGVYSSGGSVANLVALGAARQWALERIHVDPAAEGTASKRLALYTSTEAHHTIQRSAAVLGIGRANVRLIPTDGQQRMNVHALRRAISADVADGIVPVAVVAAAGTTNTGAIDPLRAVGEAAHEYDTWFHVDGAYGLPGILDDRVTPLYDGLDMAQSVIVDPHKWLGAPVGIAATFVRDRAILHRAFTQETAAYLEGSFADSADVRSSLDSIGIPYADFAVELSAPARGVVVWSILRQLGREGMRTRVRRDNDRARYLARRVQESDVLELVAEPVLSICCFRYAADDIDDLNAFNAALFRRLVQETDYLPSSTMVNGKFALRPCFINPRTQRTHVNGLIDAATAIGNELRAAAATPA